MQRFFLESRHVALLDIVILIILSIVYNQMNSLIVNLFVVLVLLNLIVSFFVNSGLRMLFVLIGNVLLIGGAGGVYFYQNSETFHYSYFLLLIGYSLIVFIQWYVLYDSHLKITAITELQRQVETLEKYGVNEFIYTMTEFEDRSTLLIKSCQRRGEDAYFLTIKDEGSKDAKTMSSMHYTIGLVLLKVCRNHYDLIGEQDETTYILFLQNITEDNIQIVIRRFYEELQKIVELNQVSISFQSVHYKKFVSASGEGD